MNNIYFRSHVKLKEFENSSIKFEGVIAGSFFDPTDGGLKFIVELHEGHWIKEEMTGKKIAYIRQMVVHSENVELID